MVIPASLAQYISTHNIQCVIGMHAWRAGHLLQGKANGNQLSGLH